MASAGALGIDGCEHALHQVLAGGLHELCRWRSADCVECLGATYQEFTERRRAAQYSDQPLAALRVHEDIDGFRMAVNQAQGQQQGLVRIGRMSHLAHDQFRINRCQFLGLKEFLGPFYIAETSVDQ